MVYWNEYRGIRYGRKPVRFEKPVPVASSSNTKMAKEYANMCVQYRKTGYERQILLFQLYVSKHFEQQITLQTFEHIVCQTHLD